MQVLKENSSKQKTSKVFGERGVDHPRTPPPQHPGWGCSPCPGLGRRWGTGRAAVSQQKGICLSPVLVLKSGTNLWPKYFLWDGAIRTSQLVRDASSVPNGGGAPPCFRALPRSHGSSPSTVFEPPNRWLELDFIARLRSSGGNLALK